LEYDPAISLEFLGPHFRRLFGKINPPGGTIWADGLKEVRDDSPCPCSDIEDLGAGLQVKMGRPAWADALSFEEYKSAGPR